MRRSGDVLALVSAPAPDPRATHRPEEMLDRARYGQYPPGSTFKLVTAMAALRLDPQLKHRTFLCHRLPDGRAGNTIPGWNRADQGRYRRRRARHAGYGAAITVSCNAYFAQLGVHDVGSQALAETAAQFGITTGDLQELRHAFAVRVVRAGRGADFAVQDGARGGGDRGGREDAGRALDRR